MATDQPKKSNLIVWVLFFLAAFYLIQQFTKNRNVPPPDPNGPVLTVSTTSKEYVAEQEVILKVRNNSASPVTLPSRCPKNPFKALVWGNDKFEERSSVATIKCERLPDIVIQSKEEKNVTYAYWNHSLFGTSGRYKISVEFKDGEKMQSYDSPEFTVVPPGAWRKFFRTFFYRPLFNVLIFLISKITLYNLGFAIILLTILIRLILLVPSQKAMVSQRKLQAVQPKLEEIKKKYAGNQQRIAEETMKLWKENKVNPFGSCLPLLVQLPVLWALFYVVQSGLSSDNGYLLYNSLSGIDFNRINTHFLGILELTKIDRFVLPIIVGVLQFLQMKIAMAKKKKPGQEEAKPMGSEMEMANKTMIYVMPIMIALFTASTPSGVGLYWGISTLFALVQQMIANKKVNV